MAREYVLIPVAAVKKFTAYARKRDCEIEHHGSGLMEISRSSGSGLIQLCRGATRYALGARDDERFVAGWREAKRRGYPHKDA